MEQTKQPFSLRSYGAFVRGVNSKSDLLKGDWKDILSRAFELSGEQKSAIAKATESDSRALQKQFDAAYQHICNGGKIKTRIYTRSDGSHGLKMVLDGAPDESTGHSLVCCGADCHDWGVWCADPPQ